MPCLPRNGSSTTKHRRGRAFHRGGRAALVHGQRDRIAGRQLGRGVADRLRIVVGFGRARAGGQEGEGGEDEETAQGAPRSARSMPPRNARISRIDRGPPAIHRDGPRIQSTSCICCDLVGGMGRDSWVWRISRAQSAQTSEPFTKCASTHVVDEQVAHASRLARWDRTATVLQRCPSVLGASTVGERLSNTAD